MNSRPHNQGSADKSPGKSSGRTHNILRFEDLFDLEEVQRIQDAFAEATGVASIITDPRGFPITRPSNFCTLCNDIIRKTEKGRANCYHSDAILGRQNPEGPVVQRCLSGGLWDGGTSITVGGLHVANWLIGQILDDSIDMERMIDYAREIGADEEPYRKALAEVTRMSESQFRRICNTLTLIARLLSDLAYENVLKEREIEETVRSRTEELRLMQTCIDKAADAIYWVDQKGRLIYANEAACTLLKYSPEEMTSLNITDIDATLTKDSWPGFWNQIKYAGGAAIQTRQRDKSGSLVNIEINSSYQEFGNKPYLFLFARDISERTRAIEVLRQNEARTKALLEISQMTSWSFEDIYRFTLASALDITGSSAGFIGFSSDDGRTVTIHQWSEYLDTEGLENPVTFDSIQEGIWGDTLRRRKAVIAESDGDPLKLMILLPGREHYNRFISIPALDGRILTMVAGLADKESAYTSSDVTQLTLLFDGMWHIVRQKKAEQALKENEERYALAISGSKTGVWDIDLIRDSGYLSPNVINWLEIKDRELIPFSKIYRQFVHPDDRAKRDQIRQAHLEGKAPYILEYRIIATSGAIRWFSVRGDTIRDETGRPVRMTGSITDITESKDIEEERKVMEMQLNHAQKLESIGHLAAGIAHEINTPIQYVGDNTRFLSDSFSDIINAFNQCQCMIEKCAANPEMTEKAESMKKILENADIPYLVEEIPRAISQTLEGISRVAGIVMAMKEFSHPDSDEMILADLNRAIESTVTVARNEWKYVSNLETDLDCTLPKVPCMPGAINQVILNLIINAAHAIGEKIDRNKQEKGTITIKTGHDRGFAEIRISDTGTGIPGKYRSKIFDPFFTTKTVGRGTGQGLSIAYNTIVKRHKGTISFQTEEGKGTEFLIRLPLSKERIDGDNC